MPDFKCMRCTSPADYETWDRKTFCRLCAIYMNFKVRWIGSGHTTQFLEGRNA